MPYISTAECGKRFVWDCKEMVFGRWYLVSR